MRTFIVSVILGAALLIAPSAGFAQAIDAIPAGKTTTGQSLAACVDQGNSRADCAARLAAGRAHEAALAAAREAAAEAAREEAAQAAAAGP